MILINKFLILSIFIILLPKVIFGDTNNYKLYEIKNYFSYVVFGNFNKDDQTVIFTPDPRKENIGHKFIHKSSNPEILDSFKEINEDKYHEILIKNLVPFSHYDLEENKSLLLENNFQNLNSISWDKGCYIGQEITARMKYRALLKKKIYTLNIISGFPQKDQKIKEKGIDVGKIISVKNKSLLAMMKIEFVESKLKSNKQIESDDGMLLDFAI